MESMARRDADLSAESCALVTGGSGFIGSALVRQWLECEPGRLVNYDCQTYAAVPASLADLAEHPQYELVRGDVVDATLFSQVLSERRPEAVFHLAAETHVDRSIVRPPKFVATNVVGAGVVLEQTCRYWRGLPAARRERFRLVLASTDEVFGSADDVERFDESSPLQPNSPYAAAKAAADHLARAYYRTYGLPVVVVHPTNNYGPRQIPEKLIPKMILAALRGDDLTLYGDGLHQRDWLHVDDCCRGFRAACRRGAPGRRYLLGSGRTQTNRSVVEAIRQGVADQLGRAGRRSSRVVLVEDRPGHDRRYAVDPATAERELGWRAERPFRDGLRDAIRWYAEQTQWVAAAEAALQARDAEDRLA